MKSETMAYFVRKRDKLYTLEHSYLILEDGKLGAIKRSDINDPSGVVCSSRSIKGLVLKLALMRKKGELGENIGIFTGAPVEDSAKIQDDSVLSPNEHKEFWDRYRGDRRSVDIRLLS